jgi:hypothetical protein
LKYFLIIKGKKVETEDDFRMTWLFVLLMKNLGLLELWPCIEKRFLSIKRAGGMGLGKLEG